MNQNEETLVNAIAADKDYVVALRRYFHQFPELSAQEYNTQKKIEEELDLLGLPHHRVAKTGVSTEIIGEKGEGKTIVLRADIDALPVTERHACAYQSQNEGVMHACGHDAHTAALLGAVRVLVKHKDLFAGKVLVTFQPGEEIGYGARIIVDDGEIDEANRSFGVHMASNVQVGNVVVAPGPNNASVDQFKITVHGKGAHISRPNLGVDAAFICSQIVVASQGLLNKRVDSFQKVLLGIGSIHAGTGYNIIAPEGVIEGTLRCFDQETREKFLTEFESLCRSIAAAYGGTITFENKDNTSPLVNDEQSSKEAQKTAIRLFGADHVQTTTVPSFGGDDFAEYIKKVPGVYAYIGSCNPNVYETGVSHHNDNFDIDEDALRIATELYACYAVNYLNDDID